MRTVEVDCVVPLTSEVTTVLPRRSEVAVEVEKTVSVGMLDVKTCAMLSGGRR